MIQGILLKIQEKILKKLRIQINLYFINQSQISLGLKEALIVNISVFLIQKFSLKYNFIALSRFHSKSRKEFDKQYNLKIPNQHMKETFIKENKIKRKLKHSDLFYSDEYRQQEEISLFGNFIY